MRASRVVVLGLCIVLAATSTAGARRDLDLPYRYEQVWSSAVRLLRVDLGFRIADRDPETGYLLFDYKEGSRAVPASIEIIRREAKGKPPFVRVVVNVPSMPNYMERALLEKLQKKVEDDHGAPPKTEPEAPAKRPPDASPGPVPAPGPDRPR